MRKRAVLSLIWLVPVIAAIVAGVLVFQNLQKFGPVITIRFDDTAGLDANQTVIRYRGVRVGSVLSIQVSKDMKAVDVRARLQRFAAGLARDGTIFWIVRPEVGAGGVHALETIVSGPYIEALPGQGSGKVQKKFIGANETPVVTEGTGTPFVLRSTIIRSLGPNSPVYYRGLNAGKVQYLELNNDSTVVNVHVLIKPNFTPLIRSNTVWWNAGGVDVSWHLRSGLSMTAENLRAILTGGISFATPNDPDGLATPGATYVLNEKPDIKWLAWAPQISVTNATVIMPGSAAPADTSSELDNLDQSEKQQQ